MERTYTARWGAGSACHKRFRTDADAKNVSALRSETEERERQKQLDNDYKSATSKIADQKANDPWAAIRPTPSTPSPKTPTIAGFKKEATIRAQRIAVNIAKLSELLKRV